MRLLSLKLRGAIGIWKGLGKEEISIDFTVYEPGLIALTGKNGSGKSTIIEMLQPYRCMVSRMGALETHFYLKDSYKILDFMYDNRHYRSHLQIDGLTGYSKAYLQEIIDGESHSLNDGLKTTYDEAIEKLLGTQELFFNSVFSAQKSKGIASLKPSQRRVLFYELLRLLIYNSYLENAKAKLKVEESKLEAAETRIAFINENKLSLNNLKANKIVIETNLKRFKNEIAMLKIGIDAFNKSIKETEISIVKLEEKNKANSELEKRINNTKGKIVELGNTYDEWLKVQNQAIEDAAESLKVSRKAAEESSNVEESLSRIEFLENELNGLRLTKNKLISEQNVINHKYSVKLGELADSKNTLIELEKVRDKASTDLNLLLDKIATIESDAKIIDEVPCGETKDRIDISIDFSSCQFLKNAYSSKNSLPSLLDEKEKLTIIVNNETANVLALSNEHERNKQMIEENNEIDTRENNAEQLGIDKKIIPIEQELETLRETDWNELKTQGQLAQMQVALLNERSVRLAKEIEERSKLHKDEIGQLEKEIKDLTERLDPDIDKTISALNDKLELDVSEKEKVSKDLEAETNVLEVLREELNSVESDVKQCEREDKELVELKKNKLKIQSEIKDWTFLVKAFDKTGIPVLKLENSGQQITAIANDLLSLFDSKFRIIFETTALTKDKKKTKETFDINIIEPDGKTEIANKSGGQQVWIETAIQSAISLVVRQQGKQINTSFLDEKDGQLDIENAHHYIEMIRKAHNMSGVHNTFVITHRPELLQQIPQQIKLEDGQIIILN